MKLKDAMILALEKEKEQRALDFCKERYYTSMMRKKHGEKFYKAFDSAFGLKELSGAML